MKGHGMAMATDWNGKDVIKNEVESIVEHMRKPIVERINDRYFVLRPPGWSDAQEIDIDHYASNPLRKKGTITLTDVTSFVYFVKSQGTPGTVIYVTADYAKGRATITAVLNDHDNKPQWRDYRAVFLPIHSEPWNLWISKHNTKMSQADFATFLEDNRRDIADGDGEFASPADMYKMAIEFESRREIYVKSDVRSPMSGTIEFTYTEKEDSATVAKMKMFERFRIGIQVYQNGKTYPIEARLKYRYPERRLIFWYELERPDVVLQTALSEAITTIQKDSGFPVLYGNPG
jgi:uncharacterized protein YfdQ (DUF2303 family)